MYVLQIVWAGIKKAPVKTIMTLITVGLGVGVLICSLNISTTFSNFVENRLNEDGLILTVANAEYGVNGEIEAVRPPEFDDRIVGALMEEVPGVTAFSPVPRPFWDEFKSGDGTYRIRNTLGVGPEYAALMDLRMAAGSFFSTEEIEKGAKKAVISEELARVLFGSAESALGQVVKPPASGRRGSGSGSMVVPAYEITGIFSEPAELKRKSYGIGDMLLPYTAILPGGMNAQMAERLYMSTVMIEVSGSSFLSAEARIREVLSRQYGTDISVLVWEGSPDGGGTVLAEVRESLTTITVVINLLGFILLITGSIGILSIMIVEVAGRSREIAMKKALGARKGILVREFWLRAILLSGLSGITGLGLSMIFLGPIQDIVLPIFENIRVSDLPVTLFQPLSVVIGIGAALVFGGVFGIIPVFSALKTPIAEGIREV